MAGWIAGALRRWPAVIGAGLLVLGAIWGAWIGRQWADRRAVGERGIETTAEVVEVHPPGRDFVATYRIEVAFTTEAGDDVRAEVTSGNPVGGVVRVRYDPEHPRTARLVEGDLEPYWNDVVLVGIVGGAGLVLVLIAAWPLFVAVADRWNAGAARSTSS